MMAVIFADSPKRLTICEPALGCDRSIACGDFVFSSGEEGDGIGFKYLTYELILVVRAIEWAVWNLTELSYAICVQFGSPMRKQRF